MTRTVTPAEYAALVAEDRERAQQFGDFLALGAQIEAVHHVARAAEEILSHCKQMASERARIFTYRLSLKYIERVGKRSVRRGDDAQAQWCAYLYSKLRGT